MAGFPLIPGSQTPNSPAAPASPPPAIPGVTQSPNVPPAMLVKALMRKPEQATQLIRQAIVLLEQAADIDSRQEPRIGAAVKLLRGPAKPGD